MENASQSAECCPRFDPGAWDGKISQWENKLFIKDKVFSLFYMPMNFGSVMKRLMGKIEKTGAAAPEWLCLSDHTSKWNIDIYLAVDREIPDAENVKLSGKYLSKVYEGNFKDTGKWSKDFESYVKNQGQVMKKMYAWYTTCPKCAKKYGKNYVVLIASIG